MLRHYSVVRIWLRRTLGPVIASVTLSCLIAEMNTFLGIDACFRKRLTPSTSLVFPFDVRPARNALARLPRELLASGQACEATRVRCLPAVRVAGSSFWINNWLLKIEGQKNWFFHSTFLPREMPFSFLFHRGDVGRPAVLAHCRGRSMFDIRYSSFSCPSVLWHLSSDLWPLSSVLCLLSSAFYPLSCSLRVSHSYLLIYGRPAGCSKAGRLNGLIKKHKGNFTFLFIAVRARRFWSMWILI